MLDKIRKNRLHSSIAIAVVTFVFAMILWPLMDLLWSAVITHSPFNYSLGEYVLEPAIFSVVFGIISFIFWKPTTKLEKKTEKQTKNRSKKK